MTIKMQRQITAKQRSTGLPDWGTQYELFEEMIRQQEPKPPRQIDGAVLNSLHRS